MILKVIEAVGYLSAMWGLGYFTGGQITRRKLRKRLEKQKQYKVLSNTLYGKLPAQWRPADGKQDNHPQ